MTVPQPRYTGRPLVALAYGLKPKVGPGLARAVDRRWSAGAILPGRRRFQPNSLQRVTSQKCILIHNGGIIYNL